MLSTKPLGMFQESFRRSEDPVMSTRHDMLFVFLRPLLRSHWEDRKLKRQDLKKNSNQQLPEVIIEKQLDEVKKMFLQQYRNAMKTTSKGIHDESVKLLHLSVMTVALERARVTNGSLTVSESSQSAEFRGLYTSFARGDNVDRTIWAKVIIDLWNDTLLNAAVIIFTTSRAGMGRVMEVVKVFCRPIIVDEAAHQGEVGLSRFIGAILESVE